MFAGVGTNVGGEFGMFAGVGTNDGGGDEFVGMFADVGTNDGDEFVGMFADVGTNDGNEFVGMFAGVGTNVGGLGTNVVGGTVGVSAGGDGAPDNVGLSDGPSDGSDEGKVEGTADGAYKVEGSNDSIADGKFDDGAPDGNAEVVGAPDGYGVGSKGNRLHVVGQNVICVTGSGIEKRHLAGAPPLAITTPA